jgi:hypothetical protein
MTTSNFNHINLAEQAAFKSLTTPIIADGAVTAQKFGTLAFAVVEDITYTAANAGTAGNSISITYIEDSLPGHESVTLSGTSITVHIGSPIINITAVVDSTHLLLVSTAGINVGDTIIQGLNSTTVSAILGTAEVQVVSTTGFVVGTALDNNLLSTATQVLTAIQSSYLSSFLVTAIISGTPTNKQTVIGPVFLAGGTQSVFLAGVFSDSNPTINSGTLHLISGTNISLAQIGNAITINGLDTGDVSSINGLTGAIILAAGSGISITPSGQTLTFASTTVFGNLTDTGTDGIVITNGTGAVIGTGTSISQHVSDSTHNGYLNSTDWNTFNNKQPAGNYIIALTSDVTATGPGSVAATVVSVGGSSAANIHSAELVANAATNLNTPSTIVKRDGSGNFSAGTITASLTGHASLDLVLTGGTMSGALDMAQNQILNPVLHRGTSEPGSPVEGQLFYRTDTHQAELWNGTSWVLIG